MTFNITVTKKPGWSTHIEIDGPIWTNKLDMEADEWQAFRSLLTPSTRADFKLIEDEEE
jgi:hypothetical protein